MTRTPDDIRAAAQQAAGRSEWRTAAREWEAFLLAVDAQQARPFLSSILKAWALDADESIRTEQFAAAEERLVRGLELAPNDAPLLVRLGRLAASRQDWKKASDAWAKYLAAFSLASPPSPQAREAAVQAFIQLSRQTAEPGGSLASLQAELALRAKDSFWLTEPLAAVAIIAGDAAMAEAALRDFINTYPAAATGPAGRRLVEAARMLGKPDAGLATAGNLANLLLRARTEQAQSLTARAVYGPAGEPHDCRKAAGWVKPPPPDGRPRIAFAGDTLLRSNWGCRATTTALRAMIQQRARIDFTFDVAQWEAYFGPAPPELVSPETPNDLERLADWVRHRPDLPVSRALRASDAVLINGEGAFLDFGKAGRRLMGLAFVARTLFDLPTAIINHTADFTDPRLLALAEAVYPLLTDATFREHVSLRRAGPIRSRTGAPQRFAADAILTLQRSTREEWAVLASRPDRFASYPDHTMLLRADAPYIVLGGSARFRFQPKEGHDSLADLIAVGRELQKLATVVVAAIEFQEEQMLRDVAQAIGAPFVQSSLPTSLALDLVSNAALYVGGRWHTALKGLMGGASIVLLDTNSSCKTEGLLDLFGLEQPRIDFYDAGSSSRMIAALAEERLGRASGQRERLLQTAAELASTAPAALRCLDGLSAP